MTRGAAQVRSKRNAQILPRAGSKRVARVVAAVVEGGLQGQGEVLGGGKYHYPLDLGCDRGAFPELAQRLPVVVRERGDRS